MPVTGPQFGRSRFDEARLIELRKSEAAKYDTEYFVSDYWKEDIPGKSGNRGLAYLDPGHSQRFDLLWKGIAAITNGGSFLDVGCATGILVEVALNSGAVICGVDPALAAVDEFQGRTQGRWPNAVFQGSSSSLSFADASFDVLLCFDVLEHLIVFDCFDAVVELCRVARTRIIASINLDNPYEYHPTILSRNTWVTLFEATGMAVFNRGSTERISQIVCPTRPEYDFFVFDRVMT